MNFDLFKKCIDEIAAKKLTRAVHLFGVGEPYMTPDFTAYCDYAILKVGCKTQVISNGAVIDKVPEGLGELIISFNAGTPKSYQAITGMDFEKTFQNIVRLYETGEFKKAKNVEIHALIFEDNKDEANAFFKLFEGMTGVKVRITFKYDNWAGRLVSKVIPQFATKQRYPCHYIYEALYVTWTGEVTLCPLDIDNEVVIGNANNQSLQEIINSKIKQELTRQHFNNLFAGICAACDYNKQFGGKTFYKEDA